MKSVLILCNGNPPSRQLFNQYRANASHVIAADGGANIALGWEVHPDLVIGDLDSYSGTDTESFEIIFKPSQETNDLEKALDYAQSESVTHVNILGATGCRLDQTLKNLSVLKKYDAAFHQLQIIDDYGITTLLPKRFTEQISIGTQLSLFPLSGKVTGIRTKGLKYRLNNEPLENGVRDGSSNEVIGNPVEIYHQQGDLLLFIKHLAD